MVKGLPTDIIVFDTIDIICISFSVGSGIANLPVVRGVDKLKRLSLLIKSKKLAMLVRAIVHAKRKQKQLRLFRLLFFYF